MVIKLSDLANHDWKPCIVCKDLANTIMQYNQSRNCPHCRGHGVEPVAVENEIEDYIDADDNLTGENRTYVKYKHQVGVPFEIVCMRCDVGIVSIQGKCPNQAQVSDVGCVDGCPSCERYCEECKGDYIQKFLPLYPKVKGDNSVLMVVKTNG